jgi:HK97 gp10 family phage protein
MKYKVTTNLKWDGNKLKIIGKKFIGKSVLKAGLALQSQAILLCPVDEGRLRGSIFVKTKDISIGNADSGKIEPGDEIEKPNEDNVCYVGTAVSYAEYIEYGTWKMDSQPFMRPSFDLIAAGKVLTVIKEDGKFFFKDYLRRPKSDN